MATLTATAARSTDAPLKGFFHRHPVIAFAVLAYAIAWSVSLVILAGTNLGLMPDDAGYLGILETLASSGPTLAGLIVTALVAGKAGVGQLLRRLIRWRVGLQWYLLVLFGVPLAGILGATVAFGGTPLLALGEQWPTIFTRFLPLVLLTVFTAAPLQEELGWRGLALPRLQEQRGALIGTVILGVVWTVWHLPNVFGRGWDPLTLAGFGLATFATAFLYTWVYNRTRGSLLLIVLLHATLNTSTRLVSTLVPASSAATFETTIYWIYAIVYGLGALLLIAVTRGTLGYNRGKS